MNWYLECFKKYATFDGRARRKEFWMFALFSFIVSLVLNLADKALFGFQILSGLYGLAVFLPGLAVSVRRLHDIDKSGWFVLLALIPFVGAIVLLVFDCIEGTRGDNRFGGDPKAVENA